MRSTTEVECPKESIDIRAKVCGMAEMWGLSLVTKYFYYMGIII